MSHLSIKDELRQLRSGVAALAGQSDTALSVQTEAALPAQDNPAATISAELIAAETPAIEVAQSSSLPVEAADPQFVANTSGQPTDISPQVGSQPVLQPFTPRSWGNTLLRASCGWIVSTTAHAALIIALGITVLSGGEVTKWIGLDVDVAERDEAVAALGMSGTDFDASPGELEAGGPQSTSALAAADFSLSEHDQIPFAIEAGDALAGSGSFADEVRSMVGGSGRRNILNAAAEIGAPGAGLGHGGGAGNGTGQGGDGNDYAMFYGSEAKGLDFVFVVDCSQSMTGLRFERACAELMRSVVKLTDKQRFYVVFFNTEEFPQFFPQVESVLSTANSESVDKLARWMRNVYPMGGTNPAKALKRALEFEPHAIFLLSDGEFDLRPTLAVLQEHLRAKTVIHTVALGSPEGQPMLSAIAELTGGTYQFVELVR